MLAGLLLFIAAFAVWDLVDDWVEGEGTGHLVLEAGVAVAGLVGLTIEARRFARLRSTAGDLAQRLAASQEQAREGLSRVIDAQLDEWALSPAEKETALLLLKGLSFTELSSLRHVSEATARQQARSVYKKAGLDGRHELAAFFLEDLLVVPAPKPTGDRAKMPRPAL